MIRRGNSRYRQVQCIGDSITRGFGATDSLGYRKNLFAAIRAYGFYSCGSQGAGGSDPYTQLHDGMDGYTAMTVGGHVGLDSRIGAVYTGTWVKPDLVILMAGMNSLFYGQTPAQTVADLKSLRALIKAAVPDAHILNLSITPTLGVVDDALIAQVAPLLAADVATESGVSYLDVHAPMLPMAGKLAGDNLHPNDAGYTQLASLIVPAVLALPIFP